MVKVRTYCRIMKRCHDRYTKPKMHRRPEKRAARQDRAARDGALVSLTFGLGLKTSEVIALEPSDFTTDHSGNSFLRIASRREEIRNLPVDSSIGTHVQRWLRHHDRNDRHMFYSISPTGWTRRDGITQRGLSGALKRRGNDCKLSLRKLRSSMEAHLKEHDVQAAILRDILGLRSRRTVERDHERCNHKMKQVLSWWARTIHCRLSDW